MRVYSQVWWKVFVLSSFVLLPASTRPPQFPVAMAASSDASAAGVNTCSSIHELSLMAEAATSGPPSTATSGPPSSGLPEGLHGSATVKNTLVTLLRSFPPSRRPCPCVPSCCVPLKYVIWPVFPFCILKVIAFETRNMPVDPNSNF